MDLTSNPYFLSLLFLIVGAVIGTLGHMALFSRSSADRKREADHRQYSAYVKGIQHLIADSPQEAIEEFVKAVQKNSESIESYMTLGSLYRAKGDVARAIRIHQGIILRPRIPDSTAAQATYELGLDYLSAGQPAKAISSFESLLKKEPNRLDVLVRLEPLYEETGQWQKAFSLQQKISKLRKTDDRGVLAHLMTRMGAAELEGGNFRAAKRAFKKALSLWPGCVETYLYYGDLYARRGEDSKAVAMWERIMEIQPGMTFVAYDRIEEAYFRMGQSHALENFISSWIEKRQEDFRAHLYMARHLRKKGMKEEARRELMAALELRPGSLNVRRELIDVLLEEGKKEDALKQYRLMVEPASQPEFTFRCSFCGHKTHEFDWKCPGCGRWDSMAEDAEALAPAAG